VVYEIRNSFNNVMNFTFPKNVLNNILSRFIRFLRFFHIIVVGKSEVLGTRVAMDSSVSDRFINCN
jgi:hypothetical protein